MKVFNPVVLLYDCGKHLCFESFKVILIWLIGDAAVLIERLLDDPYDVDFLMLFPIGGEITKQHFLGKDHLLWSSEFRHYLLKVGFLKSVM